MQEKTFVQNPEVLRSILAAFQQPEERKTSSASELVALNKRTDGKPIFWIHGDEGGVEGYQAIAQRLQRPVYGFQARGRMSQEEPVTGIPALASHYIQLMRKIQREGPYDLGGYSLGGLIAYEMARQLQESGESVASLMLIDTPDDLWYRKHGVSERSLFLRMINLSLLNRTHRGIAGLIHQQEVRDQHDPRILLEYLIRVGKERGLSQVKSAEELQAIFEKTLKIQRAFQMEAYRLEPLSQPETIRGIYFRRQDDSYYGSLSPYMVAEEECEEPEMRYWERWTRYLSSLAYVDVEANSHQTLLFEEQAVTSIAVGCEQFYTV